MTALPDEQVPRRWREHGRRDWERVQARLILGDGPDASFHLQQSLEKFLKGYLIQHGWQLRKTHELDRLLDAACAFDPSLATARTLCERVTGYYLVERYPGLALRSPDMQQIRLDMDEARQLVLALFPDEQL